MKMPRGILTAETTSMPHSGFVQSFAGNFMAFGEEALFFEVPKSYTCALHEPDKR